MFKHKINKGDQGGQEATQMVKKISENKIQRECEARPISCGASSWEFTCCWRKWVLAVQQERIFKGHMCGGNLRVMVRFIRVKRNNMLHA